MKGAAAANAGTAGHRAFFTTGRAFCLFHIRNDVPLMEWSIGAPCAWSKINLSGRMRPMPPRNTGAGVPKKAL